MANHTERTTKVDFSGVKWTMLATLYCRAYDSRSKRPILDDKVAVEAMDRIDYNFTKLKWRGTASDRFVVVLRARQLDEWTTAFLREHPDATVLQLGCGMDGRAFRLDVPDSVRWYDIDYPDVIALRRQLYPDSEGYRSIGSSVTESAWLDQIPTDRPTLIVAEGLLMYMAPDEVRELLCRLADRFPSGELLFDGMAPWVLRLSKMLRWSVREPEELEGWHPRLKYVGTEPIIPQYARIPVPGYRLIYQLLNAFTRTRTMLRLFRFELRAR